MKPLRDDVRKLKADLDSVLPDLSKLLERVDVLAGQFLGDEPPPAPAPAPASMPEKTPAPPPPQAVPPPLPAPRISTAATPLFRASGVLVTCFANQEDEGQETPAEPDDPPTKTATGLAIHYQDGMRILGCAFPWKPRPGRLYRFIQDTSKLVIDGVHQVDEGPWETHDDWLAEGRRPHAEALLGQKVSWSKANGRWVADPAGKKTENGAGGDLLPLPWSKILGKLPLEIYNGSPSGRFTIEEYDAPTAPIDLGAIPPATHAPVKTGLTLADVAARARLGLTLPFFYELGAGGQSGTAPLPGTLLKDGTRDGDCSGFGDWCEGVSRDTTGWNTDYAYNDAMGPQKHYKRIPLNQTKPGHKRVIGKRDGHPFGHEGVCSAPGKIIHCSSMNPKGHAIAETDTKWFDDAGAIAVEYLGLEPG